MYPIPEDYIRADYFSSIVAADSRRKEFDIRNQALLYRQLTPDFLFIGDSITHYWELNAYFNIPGQLIVNRGIGGDTTEYLLKRMEADMIQLHPKYCIIAVGINDSIELEPDYWKLVPGKEYDTVINKSKDNIQRIIQKVRQNNLFAILASLPAIDIPISFCEEKRKRFILDMNQEIQNLCKQYNFLYVDYYNAMTMEDGWTLLKGTTYDGLHPNAAGYDIMAKVLRDTLKQFNIMI